MRLRAACLLTVVMAACGNHAGLTPSLTVAGYTPSPGHSGVIGIVGAAPACSTAKPPCLAPSYLVAGAEVRITGPSNQLAAAGTTGKSGDFRIIVAPGAYSIEVSGGSPAAGPGTGSPSCPARSSVEVKSGSFAVVRVGCVY